MDQISSSPEKYSTQPGTEISLYEQNSIEDSDKNIDYATKYAIKWGPLPEQPRADFEPSTWNKELFPFTKWPSIYVFQPKNGKKIMPFGKYPALVAFQAKNSNPFVEYPSITVFESGDAIDDTTLISSLFREHRDSSHTQSSRCLLKRQPRPIYTRSELSHADGLFRPVRRRLTTAESYRERSQRRAFHHTRSSTNTQTYAIRSLSQNLGSSRRVTFASPLSVIHESPDSEDEDYF